MSSNNSFTLDVNNSSLYKTIYPDLGELMPAKAERQENESKLNAILNKIRGNGIQKLEESELNNLKEYVRNKEISIKEIRDVERGYKKEIDKTERTKKIILVVSAMVVVAAVSFALAYFAAPAIALALTISLAAGPAGAAPAVVAAAKAALAAGTFIKLGAAHGILSLAYMGLPMTSFLFFYNKQEQENKRNLEYSLGLQRTFSRILA